MKSRLISQCRSKFTPNSLQNQLLSRSLLILAGLLVLVGLLQYVVMRDFTYKNKAASLQTQLFSIPMTDWQSFSESQGNDGKGQPLIFLPESRLAFIDRQGNYSILSSGPGDTEPPRLDMQIYLEAMNEIPGFIGDPGHPNELGQKFQPGNRIEPGQKFQPGDRIEPGERGEPNKPGSRYRIISSGEEEQLVVLQPVFSLTGNVLGVVQISSPTRPLKEFLVRQMLIFLLLSLVALLFGLLAYLPVLKKSLVPLSNMVETAEQIDSGNLDRRFPTQQGQMEIDRLSESFNGMLERLEASFEAEQKTKEQMRRFIADASHELRTPLTSIRGFLEVLLRGAVNQPDQLDKALRSMNSESGRLTKLVQDLLLLNKLDRKAKVEFMETCLDSVILEMEPQFHILAGKRKLDLFIEPNLKCRFDVDQMKQVVLNLFHNAVQHTDPDKGNIQIRLSRKDKGVQLSIQDNGPGISDTHLPHVFDRFYRSDSSRTRKYGGSGLGLSITQSIVNAHGGRISVVSKEGEGSTFYVWLPE